MSCVEGKLRVGEEGREYFERENHPPRQPFILSLSTLAMQVTGYTNHQRLPCDGIIRLCQVFVVPVKQCFASSQTLMEHI